MYRAVRELLVSPKSFHRIAPAALCNNGAIPLRHTSHRSQHTMATNYDVKAPEDGLKLINLLVVTKLSRFAYEKVRHPEMSDTELAESLNMRGSMYKSLKTRHDIHQRYVDTMIDILTRHGCHLNIVSVGDLNKSHVEGVDAVLSAGGDGTFLSTASFVEDSVPLIGINTDPERSQGHLCLKPRSMEPDDFDDIFQQLRSGDFYWRTRSRIRIRMQDNVTKEFKTIDKLALNDVLFTERDSARATYYQLTIDGDREKKEKQKASSMLVCTGTGSTAWMYTLNRLWAEESTSFISMLKQLQPPKETAEWLNNVDVEALTRSYNEKIVFPANDSRIQYSVREPVCNGIFFAGNRQGFAKTIAIKSRSIDAQMILDGVYSYPWCDGDEAFLSIDEEDALLTVELKERQPIPN